MRKTPNLPLAPYIGRLVQSLYICSLRSPERGEEMRLSVGVFAWPGLLVVWRVRQEVWRGQLHLHLLLSHQQLQHRPWEPPTPPPPPSPPTWGLKDLLELASVATSLRSVCSHWTNWETIILSNYIPRVWSIFIFISSYLMHFLFPHSVIQDGFMFNIIRVFLLNQGYSASIENDWYRK